MTRPKGSWDKGTGIRHEVRPCLRHGDAMHAHWKSGSGDQRSWQCTDCHREIKDAATPRGPQKPPERMGGVCPSCGLVMPLTGVCDDCA